MVEAHFTGDVSDDIDTITDRADRLTAFCHLLRRVRLLALVDIAPGDYGPLRHQPPSLSTFNLAYISHFALVTDAS
ncbi:hypothetical protein [Sagittula salina]|uniref:Uncharacterized protein n=1 Tax=Sagittula salina TaxID=2820268 RepID=A0A940MQ55_9RHOB|nr:hypothetical protein [Sagittula salina]MBP0483808.1 hypothetical protein [Sagittula salina]